jgi:glycosyltransferase involved in cell wall biosynthesis
MKKRIAVWMHGGVGTGHFSQGYPMLEKLLDGLSVTFDLVVYSRFAPNKDFRSLSFTVRSAPTRIRISFIRWIYLIVYFLRDHRSKRFHLLFAFWGYPAGFIATVLSKFVGVPSAVYLLGSDSFGVRSINFGILHKPIISKIALWSYRRAALLLGISEFQKASLARFGVTNVTIIPWGTDSNEYRFNLKKRDSPLRVIHVGSITPVKDQATLIKAFAIIAKQHPAELRFFGQDLLEGKMQNLCATLGVAEHVQFLGVVPYFQMRNHYTWANVLLHTSLVEGQCMAITEAVASGVLVAGTRAGILADLGDDCGIIVEPGDYEGLAAKVLTILTDDQLWEAKVENAGSWAEAHDLAWTVGELKTNLLSAMDK